MDDVRKKVDQVVKGLEEGKIRMDVCEWYESTSKGTKVIVENPFASIDGHLPVLLDVLPFWCKIGNSAYIVKSIDEKSNERRLGLVIKGPA